MHVELFRQVPQIAQIRSCREHHNMGTLSCCEQRCMHAPFTCARKSLLSECTCSHAPCAMLHYLILVLGKPYCLGEPYRYCWYYCIGMGGEGCTTACMGEAPHHR